MSVRKRILVPMVALTIVSCGAVLISSILLYTNQLTESNFVLVISLITATVLAICIILARFITAFIESRLKDMVNQVEKANEHIQIMLDAMPLSCTLWGTNLKVLSCNNAMTKLFGLNSKQECIERFAEFLPEFQPNGRLTIDVMKESVEKAIKTGKDVLEFTHRLPNGEPIPIEVTVVGINDGSGLLFATYARDLREYKQMMQEIEEAQAAMTLQLLTLNLVVKATKIAVWDMEVVMGDPVNPHNKFVWSDEFRSLLGFTDENDFPNVLESWIERLHPEDRENVVNAFAKHILDRTGKTSYDAEYRIKKKNGEYAYHRATGETIRDEYGSAVRVAGAQIDITESKKHLLEISTIRDLMKKMLESMDTMIKITEIESDNVIYLNEKFKKEFNFSSDIAGQKCWKLLVENAVKRCSFCPKNNTMLNFDRAVSWEFFNPKTKRRYKVMGKFIDWSYGSKVFMEQYVDITEAKELEKTITEANERLTLMLNTSPLSAMIWDKNLEVVDCNDAAVKLYGFKNKEEFMKRSSKWCSPEFQPDGQRSDEKAMQLVVQAFDQGYCAFEWMHRIPADGSLMPSETILVRTKYHDEDVVVEYTRDLREQKEFLAEIEKTQESLRITRDAAEAANRTKSIFLANMSHEIRTPMNSIIGFSELAQCGDIPAKTREYLTNIHESAEWLLKIINDILDISKIESGKIVLEQIPFDLPVIFAHCQSVIIPKAEEKGIMIYCYAEPSVGKKLLGDPIRVRQVLINLLSNAIKFTNVGTVKLLASVKQVVDDRITISFEIKDSGIGMTSEQIAKIFEPFTQADDSVTRRFGGTGLGLTIVKNFIELMGGVLSVESVIGVGSKFSFELTFDLIDDVAGVPSEKIVINEFQRPVFKGHVLICEDNALNRQVICDHLERVGLKHTVAHNGKEGIDIIKERIGKKEEPFDLIFMDIHMPVMDGLDAASSIKKLGIKTPIVALTANVMSNDLELYRSSGMSDCLGKPFLSQDLWKCLIKYIPVEHFADTSKTELSEDEEKILNKLKLNFVKENQTTFNDIVNALDTDDIKTAHRIAHSLKSNAGQIGKKHLQAAATAVEAILSEGKNNLKEKHINNLEAEMKTVLEELAPLMLEDASKQVEKITDAAKVLEILRKLEPMLKDRNPECEDLIDEIRAIPNAEELVLQTERFNFKKAIEEFDKVKKKWETSN
jgi:PAS domain S-box-containing protein